MEQYAKEFMLASDAPSGKELFPEGRTGKDYFDILEIKPGMKSLVALFKTPMPAGLGCHVQTQVDKEKREAEGDNFRLSNGFRPGYRKARYCVVAYMVAYAKKNGRTPSVNMSKLLEAYKSILPGFCRAAQLDTGVLFWPASATSPPRAFLCFSAG